MADATPTEATPEGEAPVATEPAPDAEPAAPPLSEGAASLLARLTEALGTDAIVDAVEVFDTLTVRVLPDAWRRSAEVAREALECDYLSFVSGIDWMPMPRPGGDDDAGGDTSQPVQPTEMTFGAAGAAGRYQAFAHVESTRHRYGITFKTDVAEPELAVQSWVPVYPGADWHERECWEMYGFVFDGHPALRHLYLPAEFEGHPLRKDFPLLAREVKPWPGLVDVEAMPGDDEAGEGQPAEGADA